MRRLGSIALVGLAAAVAFGLFQLKYEVQRLEERLAEVRTDIRRDREALHVLEAEWSYLNRPERIARLAERHLALQPLRPAQVRPLAALPPPQPAAAPAEAQPQPQRPAAGASGVAAAEPAAPEAAAPQPAAEPAPADGRLPAAVRRTLASLRSAP